MSDDPETEGSDRKGLMSFETLVVSKVEAKNLNPEPPAANAVTLSSKARTITTTVIFLVLFTEKDLFPNDI